MAVFVRSDHNALAPPLTQIAKQLTVMVADKQLQRWMISTVACALLNVPTAQLWSAMACHRSVTADHVEWTFRFNKAVAGHRTPELRVQHQGPV